MGDKIVILNDREALVLRSDRDPVRLTCDTDIRNLLTWMIAPETTLTLEEYESAVAGAREDTLVIPHVRFGV